jgi:hypothetical protein
MDNDGPFPVILLVMLSLTLVVTCYLMSQAQIPTTEGGRSAADSGQSWCVSYLGTAQQC